MKGVSVHDIGFAQLRTHFNPPARREDFRARRKIGLGGVDTSIAYKRREVPFPTRVPDLHRLGVRGRG
jgi:hypothetical protein